MKLDPNKMNPTAAQMQKMQGGRARPTRRTQSPNALSGGNMHERRLQDVIRATVPKGTVDV